MIRLTLDHQAVQLQRILAGMGPEGGTQGGRFVDVAYFLMGATL